MKVKKFVATDMRNTDMRKLALYLVNYWKSRGMNQFSLPWTIKYLINGMTHEMKTERFVLFDNEGGICGTIALLRYVEHVAEIRDEIWEDDNAGSMLINHLIKYAKKKKIRKLYSLALRNKTNFYRRRGFVKEGLLKDQFKKGEDVTVMSKFI